MRQIVLDTETTGLDHRSGHRLIEIAGIEMLNRRPTQRQFHKYLNPERAIDASATEVHGLTLERLAPEPRFADIVDELLEFISGAELVIHNAEFDVGFIDMELNRVRATRPVPASVREICQVQDTLVLARSRHPGQRNNLDALCKRYHVDASAREWHGALLDARLLMGVYLAMTGGQGALDLERAAQASAQSGQGTEQRRVRPEIPLRVLEPTALECAEHDKLVQVLRKSSGDRCLWTAILENAT